MTAKKNAKLSKSMKGNKNSVGNKGGQPTKYKKAYCKAIIEFFSRKPFEPVMITNEDGVKTVVLDKNGQVVMSPCMLPTFEGFALSIDVHRETLLNWTKDHPEFFDAYKKAKDHQKDILIQNGLLGNYEKTFAIFTAKNVTDMSDKVEAPKQSLELFLSGHVRADEDDYL